MNAKNKTKQSSLHTSVTTQESGKSRGQTFYPLQHLAVRTFYVLFSFLPSSLLQKLDLNEFVTKLAPHPRTIKLKASEKVLWDEVLFSLYPSLCLLMTHKHSCNNFFLIPHAVRVRHNYSYHVLAPTRISGPASFK